ncbi:hypothetical protein PSV08DRAFT_353224 [Bipolaris maydis]|uniref:uncharacterized protein n=1 Tax=Cochliobolus heterostrophus TaxID=5016 RepID=UPI0024D942EF|nr:hypothetical protein PSV08DRAFT_353224 [Bipolaris maydis]
MAAASSATVTLITRPNLCEQKPRILIFNLTGIGRSFLEAIVARPNNIVIACVRDPSSNISQRLLSLPKGKGSQVKLVKLDSAVDNDPASAIELLRSDGVEYIDRVIANAGIGDVNKPPLDIDFNDIKRHMQVNFYGVFALVKAAVPLLQQAKDPKGPKMIFVGSGVASFAKSREFAGPWFCYGVTKTAVDYTASQLHLENKWLTSVALSPGWVRTSCSTRPLSPFRHPVDPQCFLMVSPLKV